MKKLTLVLSMLFLFSCGGSSYEKPDFYFEGDFKPSLADGLEVYVKELAGDRNFRVFEKDRDQMKELTQGEDALYISLYKGGGDKPVLWVSNVGAGTVLTLGLLSNDSFSLAATKKLSDEILLYLKKEMGIQMSAVSPSNIKDIHKFDIKAGRHWSFGINERYRNLSNIKDIHKFVLVWRLRYLDLT